MGSAKERICGLLCALHRPIHAPIDLGGETDVPIIPRIFAPVSGKSRTGSSHGHHGPRYLRGAIGEGGCDIPVNQPSVSNVVGLSAGGSVSKV